MSGISFTPTAALFFGNNGQTTFDLGTGAEWFVGAAFSSTDERASGYQARNGQTTEVDRVYASADRCMQASSGGATNYTCDFSGFTADGFTVNVSNAPSASTNIYYVLLGGDVTGGETFFHNLGSTSGTKTKTLTNGGTPSVVLFFPSVLTTADTFGDGSGNVTSTLGWMCADGTQGCTSVRHTNGSGTIDAAVRQRTDKCISSFSTAEVEIIEAEFSSVGAGEYTINLENAPGTANLRIHGCALYGGQWTAGSFTSSTTTGDFDVSVPGIDPAFVMLSTRGEAASETKVDGGGHSMGAGSSNGGGGFAARTIAVDAIDGSDAPTVAASYTNPSRILADIDATTPSVNDLWNLTSLGTAQFTYNHTQASGAAPEIIFLAAGSTTTGGGAAAATEGFRAWHLLNQQVPHMAMVGPGMS